MTHCSHKVKDPKTKRMRYCRNKKSKGKSKCKRHNLTFTYSDESIEIEATGRKYPKMVRSTEEHEPAVVTYGGRKKPKKKTVRYTKVESLPKNRK